MKHYGHGDYCLVYLDVPEAELGEWVIKFLRHRRFRTRGQRLGKVVKVSPTKLIYWELYEPRVREIGW